MVRILALSVFLAIGFCTVLYSQVALDSWHLISSMHSGLGGVVADLDGDGTDELIVPVGNALQLWTATNGLLVSNGEWSLQTPIGPGTFYAGSSGDLNGDGLEDLVLLLSSPASLIIIESAGLAGTGAITTIPIQSPRSIELFDGDGDGDLDIIFGVAVTGTVMELHFARNDVSGFVLGVLNGSYSSQRPVLRKVGGGAGTPDNIAAFSCNACEVTVMSVDFGSSVATPIATLGALSLAFDGVDVNNDGLQDLVIFQAVPPISDLLTELVVYYQIPGGGFLPSAPLPLSSRFGLAEDITSIDLDDDGFLDIVGVGWSLVQSIGVLRNTQGLGFEHLQDHVVHDVFDVVALEGATSATVIAFEDGDDGAMVFSWAGDGFHGPSRIANGELSTEVVVADLSSDECHEVFWVESDPQLNVSNLKLLTRDASCNDWGAEITVATLPTENVKQLEVSDVNADGLLDLVGWYSPATSFVVLQSGSGWLAPVLSTYFGGLEFTLADVNLDGLPDRVSSNGDLLLVSHGDGVGHFASPVIVPSPGQSIFKRALVADLDEDGFVDAFVIATVPVIHWGTSGGLTAGEMISFPKDLAAAGMCECDGSAGSEVALLFANELMILEANAMREFRVLDSKSIEISEALNILSNDVTGDGLDELIFESPDGHSGLAVMTSDPLFGYATDGIIWGASTLESAAILPAANGSIHCGSVVIATNEGRNVSIISAVSAENQFVLGDANQDGFVNIADPVSMLNWLFSGATAAGNCSDAWNVNHDDFVNIADPVHILSALFGAVTPAPGLFVGCISDLDGPSFGCISYPGCP